jgi:predicted aldo/keto reductase-like oxidoreductase
MQYSKFGNNGIEVSALGFGCMRLPKKKVGDKEIFDHDESVRIIRKAIDNGVNYIDTGYFYCDKESETIVGKALQDGYREKVYLSTKLPVGDETDSEEKIMAFLKRSLESLQTDYIDFYHLWGIGWKTYEEKIDTPDGVLPVVLKAKEQGLIKHLSFSFHDKAENMTKIIDTGHFDSVLCQYNLLDQSNAAGIEYAAKKGLGVVIMGPVAGGRLGAPSEVVQNMIPGGTSSSAELALRYVISNPHVNIALSGMGNEEMVNENIEVASRDSALTEDEKKTLEAVIEEKKKLAELYCTGCNYCMPCPQNVDIPGNFEAMNLHKVYGLTAAAKAKYAEFGKTQWTKEKLPASACIECGICEDKCPQKIEIRKQLKETHRVLSA